MNFYNITIVDNEIEYNGSIMIDANNNIYGTSIYEGNKKALISGNFSKDSIYLELKKEDDIIPIKAEYNYNVPTFAEMVFTGTSLKTFNSIIEITSFNKIKDDLEKNFKIRNCSNCYYGHMAIVGGKTKKMWCELNEFGSISEVGPSYCCQEHLFSDKDEEINEEDYKRKIKTKEFRNILK